MAKATLLISSPDRRGITASVTQFIFKNNGNILHADQHIDEQSDTFFMRVVWTMDGFRLKKEKISAAFRPVAARFKMQWELSFDDEPMNVAVFASRQLHCLYDLLYRYRSGQLPCEIPLIISNHPDGEALAEDYGIKYVCLPVTKKNKAVQEKKELQLLKEHNIELVVLARYHQILSPAFVRRYENRIINIHHSFLPAFAGSNPYAQAHSRGVKIIGATSHYVTAELDQGPIIEQDTVRVNHRDSLDDLKRKGEDLEKAVLARAVRWHLQRKILCYDNKTVVFE